MKLAIIVGSVREERFAAKVLDWYRQFINDTKFDDVEVYDLAEINLPLSLEAIPPSRGMYQKQEIKDWAKKVAGADAFIVMTPEYNHSTSGVLKNAFDAVFAEWNFKPVSFVAWGSRGGVRAVENLLSTMRELKLVPLREEVNIHPWGGDVNEAGEVESEKANQAAKAQLEVIYEYATALKQLR